MPDLAQVPPGRAGRLWLAHRLDTAERGAELLDRKLRVLRADQERFRIEAERTGERWRLACAEADAWVRRAAMLGGEREIRLGQAETPADVTVHWGAVMGVRYPARTTCRPGGSSSNQRGPGTAALVYAGPAVGRAVAAAAEHAAAQAACRIIDAEAARTHRLLRAVRDRWIPRLARAMRELSEQLEETERSESIRRRWAGRSGRREGGDHAPSSAGSG